MTHLQWCFFVKIVYRSSILRPVMGVVNLPWVFFRFTFIIDLFSTPNINTNGMTTLHTNVCVTTEIPQQCLLCPLDVLVNFGQIFSLVLDTFIDGFSILFVYCECYLMTYFVENQKGVMFMGLVAKRYFPTVPMIKVFFRDFCL